MFTLYNTDKELTMDDYRQLPIISGLSYSDRTELLENLLQAIENAFIYHCPLLENALYDDIVTVKKRIVADYIHTLSSGTVAQWISNDKYIQIDKAINNTLYYIYNSDDTIIFDLQTDTDSIRQLLIDCYQNKKTVQ